METTKLYQNDTYLTQCDAQILTVSQPIAVNDSENSYTCILTLTQTVFFPEGGGQSCDLGKIDRYPVIDVQEQDNVVLHTVKLDAPSSIPSEGDTVHCQIDWNRRFDNMQRHCGEHILSGVFYRLYGGVNRGFHMGHDAMTVDISLEENPDFTELTFEMALEAERQTNQIIWSDAPVTVLRFASREEAEKMPLRKALAFDEDISIVSVGSVENAADCVACCGTHPSSAGQVGLLKIFKVEKYKGMFRVYFEAGQRALQDYERKHQVLTELSNRYSSSIEEFPDKLNAQEEKMSTLKNQLFQLKKAFTDLECAALDQLLAENEKQAASGSSFKTVLIHRLKLFSLDDAFNMAKRYMGKPLSNQCKPLILLYSEPDTSFILVSDGEPNCGALVKEYASFYQGKGGGNNVSARAIFPSQEQAMLFADLVSKHLKP